jgi:hypothetical protein
VTPVYKLSASSVTGRTNYGSMLAGNPAFELPGDFESIATAVISSPTASVSFTSIPQTYKHLQIRAVHQGSQAYGEITLNSGSWTRRHYLYGDGISSVGGTDTANALFGQNSTHWSITILDLLDYTSTNKNRVYRALNGTDQNGSGIIHLFSGLDTTTTATNSITITVTAGGTWSQYSHFALYGIKGA